VQIAIVDPHRPRSGWSVGHNVLLRNTNRVKVLIVVAAAVTLALAISAGATVGAAVYGSRHQRYVQEAHARRVVTATVLGVAPPYDANGVRASWSVDGVDHIGRLSWIHTQHAGGRVEIWVDQDGNAARAPTPMWRAGADAVAFGYVVCIGVMIWSALLVTSVVERLARAP
jgi:hypothetical protein